MIAQVVIASVSHCPVYSAPKQVGAAHFEGYRVEDPVLETGNDPILSHTYLNVPSPWQYRSSFEGSTPRTLRHARLDTYRVPTYPVYTMNVTIALSEDLVARVREIAQSQGTTLNELVRRQLELIAGRQTGEALAEEMRKLWAQSAGRSSGKRIRRSDAYDPRRS